MCVCGGRHAASAGGRSAPAIVVRLQQRAGSDEVDAKRWNVTGLWRAKKKKKTKKNKKNKKKQKKECECTSEWVYL